jgi:hypothetical protein
MFNNGKEEGSGIVHPMKLKKDGSEKKVESDIEKMVFLNDGLVRKFGEKSFLKGISPFKKSNEIGNTSIKNEPEDLIDLFGDPIIKQSQESVLP